MTSSTYQPAPVIKHLLSSWYRYHKSHGLLTVKIPHHICQIGVNTGYEVGGKYISCSYSRYMTMRSQLCCVFFCYIYVISYCKLEWFICVFGTASQPAWNGTLDWTHCSTYLLFYYELVWLCDLGTFISYKQKYLIQWVVVYNGMHSKENIIIFAQHKLHLLCRIWKNTVSNTVM